MDTPGIEIRPIKEMTGTALFNEVFFTDVRLPAANLVGDLNGGWALAKVTLANERVSLSGGGALWGSGPSAGDLLDQVRAEGGVDDPRMRQRLAALHIEAGCSAHPAAHGDCDPRTSTGTGGIGAQGARRRARSADRRAAKDLAGTSGMLTGDSAR
jgi:alkylation response protein AidB-like acyl-CoA dehydrogenase